MQTAGRQKEQSGPGKTAEGRKTSEERGGTSPRYGRGSPPAVPSVPAGLPQGLALRAGAGPAAARGRQAVHIAPGLSRLLERYPWAAVPAAALRIPLPKGCALGGPGAAVGDALRL
ncbi:hypothetical protein E5288_WYG002629 [Bos mutus]|uniref:Uncharacterized protein n=1 Tax=Bos mutus TaxID=72004 RepID=A0A6B0R3U4_9CETA|nr:hypothetical protein [Bos mutus]